jgi:hypothetical protein
MAAFQQAFDDYAADCAKSPDCPLGQDPAKAVDRYHALVDPLATRPAAVAGDPRGLGYPTPSPAPSTRSTPRRSGST